MLHYRSIPLACLIFFAASACSSGDSPEDDMDTPARDMPAEDLGPDATDDLADMAPRDLGADGAEEMDMEAPASLTLETGAYEALVEPRAASLSFLSEDGSTLLRFPSDGLQVGVVAQVQAARNYNPTGFLVEQVLGNPPPAEWRSAERIEVAVATPTALSLSVTFEGGITVPLSINTTTQGRVRVELSPTADASIAYIRLRPVIDAEEGLYGLGEWFDSVEHRGKVRSMQLEIDSELESGYNEAHVPLPMVLGTRGWGMFVESFAPAVFDLGAADETRIDAIFGTGTQTTQGFAFYLFGEEEPIDLTRHYYEITGQMMLPAQWALGPLVWRDENEDQAQVISDAETMRDLDLPASGYWIDRPYATAVNTFDFDADKFTDAAMMIDRLHELGLRVALWHTPYLDEDNPATQALRMEARSEGYYPPTSALNLNQWGTMIDLTNPMARAWWQQNLSAYTALGIEGFKLDYGEDVVPGPTSTRLRWKFWDRSTEQTMHARFQRVYHSTYAEALSAPNGHFLLCRGGTWGDQINGPIIWPGDLDANMAYHREEVTKEDGETYVAVGGLPAAVIAGSGLGPSGFPFFGSDTGGYRHSPPDKETFTRWFQHTALSPVMQIGTSTNDVAWEPTPANGFDAEMLEWYRDFTRLHLRLWPYLWTYAEQLDETGRAIQRPLGLAYPDLGVHPDFIYMLGDALLVAPVVDRGARTKDVIFPPGAWINWFDGSVTQSAPEALVTDTVDAPLDTLPLWLAAGGIVPLLRPTIDTLAPALEVMRVDSYAMNPGRLYPVIGAGADGSFEVFDGASITVTVGADGAHTVQTRDGDTFDEGMQVELIGVTDEPTEVLLDGAPLARVADGDTLEMAQQGWLWQPAPRRSVVVRVPAGMHAIDIAF